MELQKSTIDIVCENNQVIVNPSEAPSYSFKVGDIVIEKDYYRLSEIIEITDGRICTKGLDENRERTFFKENGSEYSTMKYFINTFSIVEGIDAKGNVEEQVNDIIAKGIREESKPEETSQHALVSKKNADLIAARDRQCKVARRAEALKALVKRKAEMIDSQIRAFSEQISKMNKVLFQIQLYTGIVNEVHQIQSGEISEEPVSLRQLVLYMDEEILFNNIHELNSDFDFQQVDEFDKWLLETHERFKIKNYEVMLPEEKGIVVFRVRRNDKHYCGMSTFEERLMNYENRKYYILIRNGENLYRILTPVSFGEYLFPTQKQMDEIYAINEDRPRNNDNDILAIRQNMIVVQGLFDNTELFNGKEFTISGEVNLFDETTYEGKIKVIRDGENIISRLDTFKSYVNEINKEIKVGSRILVIADVTEAYYNAQISSWERGNRDARVGSGVFKVLDYGEISYGDTGYVVKKETDIFRIYSSGWRSWRDESRNVSYYVTRKTVFNYDALDMEAIYPYLYDRYSRRQISNLPSIIRIALKYRNSEKKFEDGLIENLSLKLNVKKSDVEEAIEWWKLKNKWKRGLSEDDAKALRMIERKLLKKETGNDSSEMP